MTVEANSKPPIHQRKFEIGLAEALALFSVVAIVLFEFGNELFATPEVF